MMTVAMAAEALAHVQAATDATGFRRPVVLTWAEMLLGDHDARVRISRRSSPEGQRARYGEEHHGAEPDPG
jgi:hypothetical protein